MAARVAGARALLCLRDGLRVRCGYRFQGLEQLLSGDRSRRISPELGQHGGETCPSQIGHADRTQTRALIVVKRIDRDDVGVQQLGEGLGLVPLEIRYLEHDRAAGQVGLFRQEDPGERTLSQRVAKAEAEDLVAHVGQSERETNVVTPRADRAQDGFLRESPVRCAGFCSGKRRSYSTRLASSPRRRRCR